MKQIRNLLLPEDLHAFRIHFVGIKGTGMTALVEICVSRGAVITGSDVPEYFYTDDILSALQIPVQTEFSADHITDDIQLVVYSSAYKRDENPELAEADRKGIPLLLYSEAVGAISAASFSCGISGVHGKTTTAGIAGTIIRELCLPAQVLAGSAVASFSENRGTGSCVCTCGHTYFVAETCEYRRHFMAFHPRIIVLTSVESDHQDYYPEYKDILQAFVDYILLLPENGTLIYCADDSGASEAARLAAEKRRDIKLLPYGFMQNDFLRGTDAEKKAASAAAISPYRIVSHAVAREVQTFNLAGFDAEFSLRIPGIHTVRNAAAAIALAAELYKRENGCGTDFAGEAKSAFEQKTAEGLYAFSGAKRRSEITGILPELNTVFIDDYAHHPTAIKTTLAGFKSFYPGRELIVDFMPHTYSRTAALLEEFAQSFSEADEVLLHEIYGSAREKASDFAGVVSGKILADHTASYQPCVHYFEKLDDALPYIKKRLSDPLPPGKKGRLFVTMGAGNNWQLGVSAYNALKQNGN
ncbi:MAG: UDP-N-acetylmuramate--L-alanine ligase [Bacteroides sp.]|nr:UDP-N-acetylmuramate--L-alanine ligase [Prevotella sp.]MCM1407257.1 UDP-N-acetylmuramate--L-alanine ligase [Treponema brennaborense]MCM1469745.1 UDP-N-acetylmuramate--L-alanine ligase [Bacteroides sp.]